VRRRYAVGPASLGALLLAGLALWGPIARHARAAKLLLGFQEGEAPGIHREERPLGDQRAIRYGLTAGRPVLLLHGVHPGGIDEPRLAAFATQLADRGFYVVTPALPALAVLRFDPATVDRVAAAAEALAAERGVSSVGVVGISVGGGIALRASTETPSIHAIFAIGAHYDITRLLDGWVASPEERYGPLALAHAYPGEYFAAPDPAAAAEALGAALTDAPPPALSARATEELAWLHADPMPSTAQACKMRGAPRMLPSADEIVAPQIPGTTSSSM